MYHETYSVLAASIESRYSNRPRIGLAEATSWAPRVQRRRSPAAVRMGQQDPEYVTDRATG